MPFRLNVFVDGFTRYLQRERGEALRFLAVTASFESWLQFEAAAWINENRGQVGLDFENWSINLELKKTDLWLENKTDCPPVDIEFKCVHNNKNCRAKVWELRHDLSERKTLPESFSSRKAVRLGLAVLVYLRYQSGREGGYQTLGGVVHNPWPLERFVEYFRAACVSTDDWFEDAPTLRLCSEIVQVVSLEGAVGIDPVCHGSSVWLALTAPESPPESGKEVGSLLQ